MMISVVYCTGNNELWEPNKCWMGGDLFKEWVKELDRKFVAEGRKVALLVDNCPVHPEVTDIKAINLPNKWIRELFEALKGNTSPFWSKSLSEQET